MEAAIFKQVFHMVTVNDQTLLENNSTFFSTQGPTLQNKTAWQINTKSGW